MDWFARTWFGFGDMCVGKFEGAFPVQECSDWSGSGEAVRNARNEGEMYGGCEQRYLFLHFVSMRARKRRERSKLSEGVSGRIGGFCADLYSCPCPI